MFVLEHARELSVPPDRAFALVSDPAQMNRWSEAPIERIAGGDGGHSAGVGALRRVRPKIAGRDAPLVEVIEHVDPPHELVYRVVSPATVRAHRGVVRIEPIGEGRSRLHWRVEIELAPRPLEWVAQRALVRSLERSLDAMERAAIDGVPEVAPPIVRCWDERDALPRARRDAEACLEAQRSWADRLLARGDDRGWFARVYEHVTELQLRAADEGRFAHPTWVMRLVAAFHELWERNLERRLGERAGDVEDHWVRAHRTAERHDDASIFVRSMRSIRAGMRAHIEDDLPRAIARVHLEHYAARCDLARFRADYLRMGDIFDRAGERIRDVLPRRHWTVRARVLDAITPELLRGPMMDRTYYPIAARRRQAFERAIGIAAAFSERSSA